MWTPLLVAVVVIQICAGSRRIFGGYIAKKNDFPHQVAVGYRLANSRDIDVICGGSLINPRFVLSAAHCLETHRKMVVMVGSVELDLERGTWYDIQMSIVTTNWVNGSFNYDITLLMTKKPIRLIPGRIQLINLPASESPDPKDDEIVSVCGWGLLDSGQGARYLRKLDLNVINETVCAKTWSPEKSERICSQSRQAHWGTCGGDSGGGLVYNNTLVGVLSYGTSNCSRSKPEVYSKVKKYTFWITNVIKKYVPN